MSVRLDNLECWLAVETTLAARLPCGVDHGSFGGRGQGVAPGGCIVGSLEARTPEIS